MRSKFFFKRDEFEIKTLLENNCARVDKLCWHYIKTNVTIPIFFHKLNEVSLRRFWNETHTGAQRVLLGSESVIGRYGTRHLHALVSLVLDRVKVIFKTNDL